MEIIFIINVGEYKKGDVLALPEKKADQFIGAGFAEKKADGTPKATRKKKVKNGNK